VAQLIGVQIDPLLASRDGGGGDPPVEAAASNRGSSAAEDRGRSRVCMAVVRGASAALLFGCSHATPHPTPPPVPRGGHEMVVELRALRALDGKACSLPEKVPAGAEPWCVPLSSDASRSLCVIDVGDLRYWMREIVRYSCEVDALRGAPLESACRPRCGWLDWIRMRCA